MSKKPRLLPEAAKSYGWVQLFLGPDSAVVDRGVRIWRLSASLTDFPDLSILLGALNTANWTTSANNTATLELSIRQANHALLKHVPGFRRATDRVKKAPRPTPGDTA
ncbi:hypothetical protein ABEF93_004080 [Exophiala dermatitidis]